MLWKQSTLIWALLQNPHTHTKSLNLLPPMPWSPPGDFSVLFLSSLSLLWGDVHHGESNESTTHADVLNIWEAFFITTWLWLFHIWLSCRWQQHSKRNECKTPMLLAGTNSLWNLDEHPGKGGFSYTGLYSTASVHFLEMKHHPN